MATTPLITSMLAELRTAVAAMSAPTYHNTLSAAQVLSEPIGEGGLVVRNLPAVAVYLNAGGTSESVTLTDKLISYPIVFDVVIESATTYDAAFQATMAILSDLAILTAIGNVRSASGPIPTYRTRCQSVQQQFHVHGWAPVGDTLFYGRLLVTFAMQRAETGGL